ncbi:MAG: outer membrane lipoprotein carrier protein LolA [Gemmatimonadetes bacterium]|nr:outer membrane lipoprotein carrier protein LolA [Gemmatimonadota bacterium]
MKPIPLFVTLCVLLCAYPLTARSQTAAPDAGTPEPSPDVDRTFGELEAAHVGLDMLSARFQHTKEVPLFDEKIVSRGVLYYRKPEELLLRYTEPDSSTVLIARDQIWLYYPDLKQAHRYEIDPDMALPGVFLGFGGSSDRMRERFDVTIEPSVRMGGKATVRIRMTPKAGTPFDGEVRSIELLVRRDTYLPLRCEFWEETGDHTLFEFTAYERNPKLDPALFAFTPPEGTEVFELEGESW